MSFFKRFFGKKEQKGNEITEEVRQRSLETRQLNARLNSLEKQLDIFERVKNIGEAVSGVSGLNKDSPENIFLSILMQKLINPQGQNNPIGEAAPMTIQGGVTPSLTPEQQEAAANAIKKEVSPQFVEAFKKLSDADLLEIRKKL
jgi:hypothetical protein